MKRTEGTKLYTELDRKKALVYVFANAKRGDTVVIAGKGNQHYQYWERGRKVVWDDRKVAAQILRKQYKKRTRKS